MIESADGELLVDRSSIKLDADKDKNLEFSILVRAKEGQTEVSSFANDLIEENGYGVIPSSSIKANLANRSINSTDFTVMTYNVNVPADQRSGLYKGKILLVEGGGTLTEIPIELSVRTEKDYIAAFWLILLGTFLGATWEGINKYRGVNAQAKAEIAQNEKTATALKQVVSENLGTEETNLAKLEALNQELLAKNLNSLGIGEEKRINDRKMLQTNQNLIEAGKEAEKKVQEADARKPAFSTILQVLAISLAAVLATTFVFNQFLQTNPFFSPERIQGQILAIGFGFAAYLSFENLLAQAKKTVNPTST